jgi:hypothetical protein
LIQAIEPMLAEAPAEAARLQANWKETTMQHPDNSDAQNVQRYDADDTSETYVPSYRLLMNEPTVLLAGNPYDRTDVATAAILGYN